MVIALKVKHSSRFSSKFVIMSKNNLYGNVFKYTCTDTRGRCPPETFSEKVKHLNADLEE